MTSRALLRTLGAEAMMPAMMPQACEVQGFNVVREVQRPTDDGSAYVMKLNDQTLAQARVQLQQSRLGQAAGKQISSNPMHAPKAAAGNGRLAHRRYELLIHASPNAERILSASPAFRPRHSLRPATAQVATSQPMSPAPSPGQSRAYKTAEDLLNAIPQISIVPMGDVIRQSFPQKLARPSRWPRGALSMAMG